MDQVSAKEYIFCQGRRYTVSGRVDEYEPDAILLQVVGRRGVGLLLQRVNEGASAQVVRIRAAVRQEGIFLG